MRATRARIDRKLDLLQARVNSAGSQTLMAVGVVATVLAVVVAAFKVTQRRRRRRTMPGWA
jgi:hypothetical protein